MNVVMTADGGLIETQATAEKGSFSRSQLNGLIDLAEAGMKEIFAAQQAVLGCRAYSYAIDGLFPS